MMDLTDKLRTDCYNVLRECDEFQNGRTLRTVFDITELSEFQDFLPDADSIGDRIHKLISFTLKQKLKDGKPVFPCFLEALRDRYDETNAINGQLTQLIEVIRALEASAPSLPSLSARQQQELYQRLLDLDFQQQIDQFWDVIDQYQIAAFLVHGPPRHGQQLLTRRLIRFREEWGTGQLILIDAISNGVGKDPDALWGQVAAQLDLKDKKDTQDLADKVCEWWKTQDVIFVLPTVDYIPENVLSNWLDKFWTPIATTARQQQGLIPPHKRKHLLLFLIDFDGSVCNTRVTLLDQPAQLQDSYAPLKLPPTGKVQEIDLKNWIRGAAALFPRRVDATAMIHDTQNGTPDLLYAKIFEFCGLTWQGVKLP